MAETDYKRGIVSYTSRDYESLVEEFWKMVPRLTELWQPGVDDDIWRPEAKQKQ